MIKPSRTRPQEFYSGRPQKVVRAVASCFGLPDQVVATSREVLAEHGNMSAPTILFILERLRRQNGGLPCLALGFGPGLEAEVALIV